MLKIFKKCEKSLDNLYGVQEIEDLDSYDKPFLLCISSQDVFDKSVFGLIKEGARAARVRTSDELAGGFKIDEMPFDFLGVKYEYKNIKDEKYSSLLDDFIYPFLKKGKDIKKQARKINFFTYCNATNVYVRLEQGLREKLLKDGYTEGQVREIISQISVVSLASEIDVSKVQATCISFKDVNDREVFDKVSKFCSKKMERLTRNSVVDRLGNSSLVYAFYGSGDHTLKGYFNEVCTAKPSLCACVSALVENSIQNSRTDELIPIDVSMLLKKLVRFNGEFEDNDELLSRIDESIDYGSTSKYSKNEHELLTKLDKSYKKLAGTKKFLEDEKRQRQTEVEELKRDKEVLMNGIRKTCSDVAYAQIVYKNKLWQPSREPVELYGMKTDREIREEYEKMMGIVSEEEEKYTL